MRTSPGTHSCTWENSMEEHLVYHGIFRKRLFFCCQLLWKDLKKTQFARVPSTIGSRESQTDATSSLHMKKLSYASSPWRTKCSNIPALWPSVIHAHKGNLPNWCHIVLAWVTGWYHNYYTWSAMPSFQRVVLCYFILGIHKVRQPVPMEMP